MHVGIIGCGTAGPALAIFVARAGHAVTILERAPTLHPVGAGILLQPTGLNVLNRLGIIDHILSLGARVERVHGVTVRGRSVLDLAYRDLRTDLFGVGLHRGALFSALSRALQHERVDIRCGVEALAVEYIGKRPLVRDTRKALHGPFDLLVVADGARSALRACIPHARSRRYPWGALWFVAEQPSSSFDGVLFQTYADTRRMVGFLPTGRLRHDAPPLVSMFWSVRLDEAESIHDGGIEAWKAQVRSLAPRAEPLLDQIDDTRNLILANYHDVVMRPSHSCSHGPIVFLGDAAHAMSPQLGQGANLALVDAMTLADCLSRDGPISESLARYSKSRHANLRYYQFASRWLTPLFQSGLSPLAIPRDLIMPRMCRLGWTKRQMLEALCGVKTGLMPWAKDSLPGASLHE